MRSPFGGQRILVVTCRILLMRAAESPIHAVPANEVSCDDVQTVFGTRGQASRCQCQRYKLSARESFASFPAEERAHRLRQQTDCGHPASGTTSGLIAYLDPSPPAGARSSLVSPIRACCATTASHGLNVQKTSRMALFGR